MPSTQAQKVQHLLLRAGFGIPIQAYSKAIAQGTEKCVATLFRDSRKVRPLSVSESKPMDPVRLMSMSDQEKEKRIREARGNLRKLNVAWINRIATTRAQLREKMTLFWHDHFATRVPFVGFMQDQHNTIRQHALGKFDELLLAVSRDPAMLQFLNNNQNFKAHPNENFAREVLELFTVGRGHYSEEDIREAARAFTGWGFNLKKNFVFRSPQHDYGAKTFMGKTGNWGGEDILRIILENRQTARFITRKIYRYFVNPEVDEAQAEAWAMDFYKSGYDISRLMEQILLSDHFYADRNLGARIKSPAEYLAGLMRMLNIYFDGLEGPLAIQKALGQVLFFPPGVAGWPEETAWIDSTSLMARLKIPQVLIFSSEFRWFGKQNFDALEAEATEEEKRIGRFLRARINWDPAIQLFKGKSPDIVIDQLSGFLLSKRPSHLNNDFLKQTVGGKEREEQLQLLTMRLLSTPEFQLC
jgi:uncharacterized protein (DUF1800 family)